MNTDSELALYDLKNKLRHDKRYHPASREFDTNAFNELIGDWIAEHRKIVGDAMCIMVADTAKFLLDANAYLMPLNAMICLDAEKTGLPKNILFKLLLSFANMNYIATTELLRGARGSGSDVDMKQIFEHQVDSLDPCIGKVNTISGLSSAMDVMNHVFNVIDQADFGYKGNQVNDSDILKSLSQIFKLGSIYFGIKTCIDAVILDEGLSSQLKDGTHLILYPDEYKLKTKTAGIFRLQQDNFAALMNIKADLDGLVQYKRSKPDVAIYRAWVENGHIRYELGHGHDARESERALTSHAYISTYYDFLENEALPNMKSLRILDLLHMYEILESLINIASESVKGSDVRNVEDLSRLSCTIGHSEIEAYLLSRTDFQPSEVGYFIDLLICPEYGRYNFWTYPLFRLGDNYVVSLTNTIAPNLYNLIDQWFSRSGFDLKARGKHLEVYTQEFLSQILSRKGYIYKICERKKFKSSDRKKEEIDLVLNLRDIVVVAELKCIRYPMDEIDYKNARERLIDGCKQIKRKVQYLKNYGMEFLRDIGNIENKPIVSLVITNYPNFTGTTIGDIPIVDVQWLRSYCKNSQLLANTATLVDGNFRIGKKVIATLYNTETEFCSAFEGQMKMPEILRHLIEGATIYQQPMSISGFPLQLMMQMSSLDRQEI